MRKTFFARCASAEKQRAKSKAQRVRTLILFVMTFSLLSPLVTRHSTPASSLDHLIRPVQHRLRNCEADLLGRLQIDHQLKFLRLLDWQIGGLGTLPKLFYVGGRPAEHFCNARAVIYETTFLNILCLVVHRREPALCREVYNLWSTRIEDGACQ